MKEGAKAPQRDWKDFGTVATILITGVSAVMGAVAAIRNLGLQNRASAELEGIKLVIHKRIPAYGDMYVAALQYYRALSPLETGNFESGKVTSADGNMQNVEGLQLYVTSEYFNAWTSYWQTARRIKEHVDSALPTPDGRKAYWKSQATGLSEKLNDLTSIARKELGTQSKNG